MLFLPFPSRANGGAAAGYDLKGFAVVHIKSKRIPDLLSEQIVLIRGDEAKFAGLDDFGGISFLVSFSGEEMRIETATGADLSTDGKRVKNLLSLPLTKDEFLAVIRYRRPGHFREQRAGDQITWQKPGRTGLAIAFTDFSLPGGRPARLIIRYRHNLFDLKWRTLETSAGS